MGGFKNEAIASHVEVGDRVPQPLPAREHVALKSVHNAFGYAKRSALREARNSVKRELDYGRDMFLGGLVTGLFTGMIAMLMIRIVEVL